MFVLGSAQFGFDYAGSRGDISQKELKNILDIASENEVNEIDTAIGYGKAETLLGLSDCSSFKINTKLPAIINHEISDLEETILGSLERLNISKINILYIHNVPSFLSHPKSQRLYESLLKLKQKQLIDKVGISIYCLDEFYKFKSRYKFDVVQGTFNFFDDRFLDLSHECIEKFQYRSIFLQGTLLDPRLRFGLPFEQQFRDFDDYVKKSGFISRLGFCLEYAAQHLEMLDVLIGVRSEKEIEEICSMLANREYHPNIPRKRYTDKNKILVNPSKWVRN